jgi:hypothetical protein
LSLREENAIERWEEDVPQMKLEELPEADA